jgi:hypothetical protein
MTLTDIGVLLLALAIVLLTGCTAGQWQAHASAAQIAHATAESGRTALLQHRRDFLMSAGERAVQGRTDPVAAIDGAEADWNARYGALVPAMNAYAGAVNAYVAGAFAGIRGEMAEVWSLVRMAAHVASTWNAVAELLTEVEVELPTIPEWLLNFLLGATAVSEEGATP